MDMVLSIVSIILSVLAMLVSAFAPIITTRMNNRHQLNMKEMELYDFRRADAISAYVRAVGAYIKSSTVDAADQYGKAYGEIFLYAPESLWDKISNLNQRLLRPRNGDDPELFHDLDEICRELNRWQVERGQYADCPYKRRYCRKDQKHRHDG